MTIKKLLSFICIVFFIVSVSACATSPKKSKRHKKIVKKKQSLIQKIKKTTPSISSDDVDTKDYVISEPDVLSISVWKEPELTTMVNVRPDGKISFPLIGDLFVRGLTPDELKQTLAEKLRKYIINPLVFVKVERIQSQRVFVLGAIQSPRVIPLTHQTTLLEAITLAGGVKTGDTGEEVGDLNNAYVARGNIVLGVNFYKLLRENDMSQNVFLKSGDFVYVPFAVSPGSEVYVLGEVSSPGIKPLKRGATLVEIIAKSGGLNIRDASAYINIVRGDLKNPKVIAINYKKILQGDLKKNITLKNRDIIYVSPTLLTEWDRVVAKIMPTLQMILWPAAFRDAFTTGGGLRINTGPTTFTTPKIGE